ncbi:hypothetical protein V6N13_015147 [Hibiscus sabdariffa]
MGVARSSKGLVINQSKYVLDLLHKVGMLGCKPADTPMEDGLKLNKEGGSSVDKERFQRLVGELVYLSLTRPDIALPVNMISQYMMNPNEEHMTAANKILRGNSLKEGPQVATAVLFRKTLSPGEAKSNWLCLEAVLRQKLGP